MAAISITYAADGQHRITGRLLAYDQAAVLTFSGLPAGSNRIAVVSLAGGQTVLSTAGVLSGAEATVSTHTTAVDELFRGQTRGPVAALLTVFDGAGRVMAAELPLYASARPGSPEPEELTGDYATITEVAALIAAAGSGKPTTAKTTPIDADGVTLWDSVAGFAGKFLSWASLKTALGSVFAAVTHASTHASGGTDPVTLAAIEPSTAAAVPSSAGADNQLVTEADLADLGGGGGLEVVHVVAATLTPESGKHYVCANDVQILAPDTPAGSLLWECSIYLEPGSIMSYPEGWRVSGYYDAAGANRAYIRYSNGAIWHLDWDGAYVQETGGRIHVKPTGNDNLDGFSWANAKRTVQAAFNAAAPGAQVWIAGGTYNAGTVTGYILPDGVTVYGGFAGTEGSTAERSRTPDADGIGAAIYATPTVLTNTLDVEPAAVQVVYASAGASGLPCTLNGLSIGPGPCGVYCNTPGSAILIDCIISGCVNAGTTKDGGGVSGAAVLAACTVQNCSAGRNGGGAYSGTLTNCVLSGNSASTSGGGAYSGTLTDCVLSGNSATDGGGAYSGTLTNCVLSGNSASTSGGGMYTATLTDCVLSGNIASSHGGGAHSGTLTNCVLSGNSATVGGGAHISTLTNCVLSGNSAGTGGGASSGTLTNCVLSGNSAGSQGGGAHSGTLINCLVMHNAPSGAGTTALVSVTQKNCILWRNLGTVSGTATYTLDDASLSLAAFASPLDIPAGLPSDQTAMLAAIQAGGYDTTAGSPVIDSGNSADNTTAYDLLGRTRKVGTIDIGPYEYQGA